MRAIIAHGDYQRALPGAQLDHHRRPAHPAAHIPLQAQADSAHPGHPRAAALQRYRRTDLPAARLLLQHPQRCLPDQPHGNYVLPTGHL